MTEEQKKICDAIAIELYDRNHKFYNYWKKNIPKRYWDDLYAELVCALYKNPEATVKAYEKKQHVFLATRITLNMWASTTSPFYKKYRSFAVEEDTNNPISNASDDDLAEKQELEIKQHLVYEATRHLPFTFYEDQLIKMYYIDKRAVGHIATTHGLSKNTVYANIIKVTHKIKEGIAWYLHHGNWECEFTEPPRIAEEKAMRKNHREIEWVEADGTIRMTFADINEAARVIGKKPVSLYARIKAARLLKDGTLLRYKKEEE
jgi:hypothetical protein